MKFIVPILFLLLLAAPCNGQTGRFWSPDRELSNSLINAIYQDSRGLVWIATEDGLNRFDGTRFTLYKHAPDDSTTLASNYVRTLFEDSRGRLWVGTMSGVMRYDWDLDCFRRVDMRREGRSVSPHVTNIAESRTGRVWLATAGMGLFEIEGEGAKSKELNILSSNYLTAIFEDDQGRLWIGTESNGVNRYDPSTGAVSQPVGVSGNNISSIGQHNGSIFVGTLTHGLNRWDERQGRFVQIPHAGGGAMLVKTLHTGRDGRLYVGTDGQGLKLYNAAASRLDDYRISSAPFDFSRGKVHSILHDRDSNLWLGMFQKGVVLVPGAQKRFDYWGFKSLDESPIGTNSVMSVMRDSGGTTWVGTDSDGLYGVSAAGRMTAHFAPASHPNSIPGVILNIFEDSRGRLWVGSYNKGIARVDRATGRCEYVAELAGEKVYAIAEDAAGNILAGTYGSGFYVLGATMRHFESSKLEDENFYVDELANDWISDILVDSDGLIWLAHFKGVSCYDPVRGTFLTLGGRNTILPDVVAYTLCEDSRSNLWIGSSEGLHAYDKTTGAIRTLTTADGLPHNVICGIVEDGGGNLWVSTYFGIAKYSGGKFTNYFAGDGLQGNEFTRGARFKDSRGKIYFGGIYGVTSFLPAEITDTRRDVGLIITGFQAGNRPMESASQGREFTVLPSDNGFVVEFSALEYANPERIVYQYRLGGGEWTTAWPGTSRAAFTNVEPGSYDFSVRARDNENVSPERTIRIAVRPPWWGSWWARVSYLLLGGVVIWLIYMWLRGRMRRRAEQTRHRHAEEINEAKLQFFINISHEIRTPMTLVINPLERLMAENSDPALGRTYGMIHRNASRILRLINQLMDVRKLDKGQMRLHFRQTDMVGFIEDLMHTFEYLAQRKSIRFEFRHPDERLDVWVDMNNFDKVVLNILSNAFKFTSDGGEIVVELTRDATHFIITITDSGIGIDESEIENIFERFYQVSNDITAANFGTGIGMHLTRSLVEMHHGTITAANREETSGARFVVRVPLGRDHLTADELDQGRSAAKMTVTEPIEKSSQTVKPKTKWRILVADDESEIRDYIRSELSPWFRVSEAADGRAALEKILAERPDLVISDVMMPVMGGVELVGKLKKNVEINHIPVILLTARSTPENRVEGLDVGADAYITKPFNTDVLRSTAINLIENRELLRTNFSGAQLPDGLRLPELKSADEQMMERLMRFLDENLSNSELSVDAIAVGVGMSRTHLHRRLKELTGQTTGDFMRTVRLHQARRLLGEGKFSISEVAYATGFTNLSHFSTAFRDQFGIAPTDYRPAG